MTMSKAGGCSRADRAEKSWQIHSMEEVASVLIVSALIQDGGS